MRHLAWLSLVLIASFGAVGVGWAGFTPFDHLKCYDVRGDFAPRGKNYDFDLLPADDGLFPAFPTETGCRARPIARMMCIDVARGGDEQPSVVINRTGSAQEYLCYKLKCPKFKSAINLYDEFGFHALKVKRTRVLCAPTSEGEVITTTTTTTVTTTEETTTSTTMIGSVFAAFLDEGVIS